MKELNYKFGWCFGHPGEAQNNKCRVSYVQTYETVYAKEGWTVRCLCECHKWPEGTPRCEDLRKEDEQSVPPHSKQGTKKARKGASGSRVQRVKAGPTPKNHKSKDRRTGIDS